MMSPDEIVTNAQTGAGPCDGCPAHEATTGWCVNPGLSNRDGTIMFVTEEPSHGIDWDEYATWDEYNDVYTEKFRHWRGGRAIQQQYLDPAGLTLDDVWIADSLKCRPEDADKRTLFNREKAFAHCRTYLRDEIEAVDPAVIVTLGAAAITRTLQVLGVPSSEAKSVRVSTDYGRSEFDTEWPVVISLHWAQRTLKRTEYLPVVQRAVQNALDAQNEHDPQTESVTDVTTTRIDDEVQSPPEEPSADDPQSPHQESPQPMSNQQDLNVFLVPVDWPNFGETVETEPIDLAPYTERPSPLMNRDVVRLWGARVGDGNRQTFEEMSTGDLLLFYNDKRYVGKGRVGQTFEDPEGWVTETFWNGAPSRLIYTVERYQTIDVPPNTVNRLFDYSSNYYPRGLTRVAEGRVTANFDTIWRTFKRFGQSDE